jgi:hypothetical protein
MSSFFFYVLRLFFSFFSLQLTSSVEVFQSLLDTLAHGLLTLTNPHAGVEELLVGLVSTLGVTDRGQEVVLLVEDVVTDTGQVGVLHVSVKVDLDDTVANGLLVLGLGGTGATVEDEEDGLVLLGADLLLNILLVTREELGVELDVAGLVDTVNITETSGNGEVGGDGGESLVDGEDVLGLSVEGVVVNILVVDTVLLTTGDTDFHLEPLLHGGSTLKVGGGSLDVVVDRLLRQVNHVRRVEGLAVELEVGLISIEETVQPREELLGAVVGVQDDGDTVDGGDAADVVGGGDTTSDGGVLAIVGDTLTGEVSGTTVRDLEDDGALGVTGSLEGRNDDGGGSNVHSRNGKVLLLSVLEETEDVITSDDTSLAGELLKDTHFVCMCIWRAGV